MLECCGCTCASSSAPGQKVPGRKGGVEKGEGARRDGRGRKGEGRISPPWWAVSPAARMKLEGVVRARAHMWPIACWTMISAGKVCREMQERGDLHRVR